MSEHIDRDFNYQRIVKLISKFEETVQSLDREINRANVLKLSDTIDEIKDNMSLRIKDLYKALELYKSQIDDISERNEYLEKKASNIRNQ